MFSHIFASVLVAFSLLPPVVEPANPDQSPYVTRGEAATAMLIARNPNVKVIKNTGEFPDIKKGDWYEPYVLSAERFGIISADPGTHLLRPNVFVNRAEFLKMLSLTFNIPIGYPESYEDVSPNLWYSDYAGIVQKFHLSLEDDPTHFGALRPVTQTEAANAIQVFLKLYNISQTSLFQAPQDASDQNNAPLTLYTVISTRRTKAVFFDAQAPIAPQAPTTPPLSLPEIRSTILTLVNTARAKEKLPPLTYNPLLGDSAQHYAELMAKEHFFSHVSPEGQTLTDRITATGYYHRTYSTDCNCIKGFALGENLGKGQMSATDVMTDWMNSPNHRAAILSTEYTDIGVGEYAGYWVEHFGGIILPTD